MSTLDEKYAELIGDLQKLNSKFNLFINGDEIETVQTDSGSIKTLAGVVSDLKKIKYAQKVVDHRLYSDMISDDLNIDPGTLIRIWGDSTQLNGYHLKEADGDYIKVRLQDIYDLRDFLPNPWNYSRIEKSKIGFVSELPLFEIVLPRTEVSIYTKTISGKMSSIVDESTVKASYIANFNIHIAVGPNDFNESNVVIYGDNMIQVMGTVDLSPTILVSRTSDAVNDTFRISVSPPESSQSLLPSDLTVDLFQIDVGELKFL